MRIAMVSSYPPMSCGMGGYTQILLKKLISRHDDLSGWVISEDEALDGEDEYGILSTPTYNRNEEYQEKILKRAIDGKADLLHFEHAPDLFGEDHRLIELCDKLGRAGIRSVVSLHTVYGHRYYMKLVGKPSTISWHRDLARVADRYCLHQDGMADRLEKHGAPRDKLTVIPHGTTVLETVDKAEARRNIDIPEDGLLFLFFGFVHVQKNVHTVVEAFARIAKNYPQARLLVTGMPFRKFWYNYLYMDAMRARIRLVGLQDQIIIRRRYIPQDLMASHFSAADVLLMPYWQGYGSASGIFHHSIGARKPILFARGPKFEEGIKILQDVYPQLIPSPARPSQWATAMSQLIEHDGMREHVQQLFSDLAESTSWDNVADMHYDMYKDILGA